MSQGDILKHMYHPNTTPPEIRLGDTPAGSDKKTRYSAEEIHRATDCQKFKNYEQLIRATHEGHYIDVGEFPLSLGSYSTIRKSPHGKSINRTKYRYLDKVHVDIGFGDCISVGGARYCLVFVDRATGYNWVFPLENLSATDIRDAFNLFCAKDGRFAKCFRADCDNKLLGKTTKAYLTEPTNNSDIIGAAAGHQSSHGLVESHWKTMVHMSRAYLTKKQMPRRFWFHSIVHAAQMMNMIPGKLKNQIVSPSMLVHDTKPDIRSWFSLFSVCYFHTTKDGNIKHSKN